MPNLYNISSPQPGFYTFTTDRGIIYSCVFGNVPALSPLLGIYDLEVHDFLFYPQYPADPNFRRSKDAGVLETVTEIVGSYFATPEHVLIYTCDTSDSRGRERYKLFQKWHESMADMLALKEIELAIEEDITVFGGVLLRHDCPHPHIVQSELVDKAEAIMLAKYGH